jgi:Zn-dependent protease
VNDILDKIVFFVPFILSLTVHEWAHAYAAYKLGDDTAKQLGRLSLNPIVHIDPVGTILLPLLGAPIGWAKPVPFNPIRFRQSVSTSFGSMIVAFAGPISNFVIVAISAVCILILKQTNDQVIIVMFRMFLMINLLLGIFNLIPVPPLDGSHILNQLMPRSLRPYWDKFRELGPIPLLVIVIALPMLTGKSILSDVMTLKPIMYLLAL